MQDRIDICKKQEITVFIGGWNFRGKSFKDVQFGLECLGFIEVPEIRSGPMKALALDMFQAASIDSAASQHGFILGCKILANHANHTHVCEIARRQGKKGRRSAKHVLTTAMRRFDAVECHTSNDQN